MMAVVEEFTVTLDGIDYPVVVEDDQVVVDGRRFTVLVDDQDAVTVDGIIYEVVVEGDEVEVGADSYRLEVSGLSTRARAGESGGEVMSVADVRATLGAILAIMPGKITRIMVKEGDQVLSGEAVCVLEAMKMENELRAEGEGIVTAVHISPGDDVEKGQVLVEIE